MSLPELPPEGAVLVLTDAPRDWGAVVADRNASGHRTALLVIGDSGADPLVLAEEMAGEVFRGAEWKLFDARPGA